MMALIELEDFLKMRKIHALLCTIQSPFPSAQRFGQRFHSILVLIRFIAKHGLGFMDMYDQVWMINIPFFGTKI
jgi:hypothetical protein